MLCFVFIARKHVRNYNLNFHVNLKKKTIFARLPPLASAARCGPHPPRYASVLSSCIMRGYVHDILLRRSKAASCFHCVRETSVHHTHTRQQHVRPTRHLLLPVVYKRWRKKPGSFGRSNSNVAPDHLIHFAK